MVWLTYFAINYDDEKRGCGGRHTLTLFFFERLTNEVNNVHKQEKGSEHSLSFFLQQTKKILKTMTLSLQNKQEILCTWTYYGMMRWYYGITNKGAKLK